MTFHLECTEFMRKILLDHGEIIFAIAGGAILLCYLLYARRRGMLVRRRRFESRAAMPESEWFDTYYPVAAADRPVVAELLQRLSDETGIPWTKFRPDDLFSRDLSMPRWAQVNGDLDDYEIHVAMLLQRSGVKPSTLGPWPDRLDEHLDFILRAIRGAGAIRSA